MSYFSVGLDTCEVPVTRACGSLNQCYVSGDRRGKIETLNYDDGEYASVGKCLLVLQINSSADQWLGINVTELTIITKSPVDFAVLRNKNRTKSLPLSNISPGTIAHLGYLPIDKNYISSDGSHFEVYLEILPMNSQVRMSLEYICELIYNHLTFRKLAVSKTKIGLLQLPYHKNYF